MSANSITGAYAAALFYHPTGPLVKGVGFWVFCEKIEQKNRQGLIFLYKKTTCSLPVHGL
jgi:hypothetical protein